MNDPLRWCDNRLLTGAVMVRAANKTLQNLGINVANAA
jgi:hypothetical protein